MKFISVSHEPRTKILLDMIRDISRAVTPADAFIAFAARLAEVLPVEHLVGISIDGAPAGSYRILYNVEFARLRARPRGDEAIARELQDPLVGPVTRGGFLGEVLRHPEPCLLHDLNIPDDPVLGTALARARSCMIVPVYVRGDPIAWAVSFNSQREGLSVADLDQSLLAPTLVDAMARQLEARSTVETLNARLQAQLVEVARLQRALLPRNVPQIPGLEIAVSSIASHVAGGDYYDFIAFPDGSWWLVIADVSGHGAAAATVMAMLHTLFHSYRGRDRSPAAILDHVHRHLSDLDLGGVFVTAFVGSYSPRTARMTFSIAGHCSPRRRDPRSGKVTAIDAPGSPPLGIAGGGVRRDAVTRIRPGELVLLYTDGITEAFNDSREMFGEGRLDAVLRASDAGPEAAISAIRSALRAHAGERREDDQTLVAIKRESVRAAEGR